MLGLRTDGITGWGQRKRDLLLSPGAAAAIWKSAIPSPDDEVKKSALPSGPSAPGSDLCHGKKNKTQQNSH